jgi:hypothetical protein
MNIPWPKEIQDHALALASDGLTASQIAHELHMTKNQVVGWFYRNKAGLLRHLSRRPLYSGLTTLDRLKAYHDKMDAALAECGSIPRVAPGQ